MKSPSQPEGLESTDINDQGTKHNDYITIDIEESHQGKEHDDYIRINIDNEENHQGKEHDDYIRIDNEENHQGKEHDGSVRNDLEGSLQTELVQVKVDSEQKTTIDHNLNTRMQVKIPVIDKLEETLDNQDTNVDAIAPERDMDESFVKQKRNTINVYWSFSRRRIPEQEGREPSGGKLWSDTDRGVPVADGGINRDIFVRKVFFICSVMLIYTFTFTATVYTVEPLRRMFTSMIGVMLVVVAMCFATMVSYAYCCCECARWPPTNYIMNSIATLCFSIITAFVCARYAPYIVLSAIATTLVVTLLCLGLAYTSFDFTRFLLLVIVAMTALIFVCMIAAVLMLVFHIRMSLLRLGILIAAAVLSSVMLVIEFQMILGGRSVELGEEEYVYGAYLIYVSIINLFLTLVRIIGFGDDE